MCYIFTQMKYRTREKVLKNKRLSIAMTKSDHALMKMLAARNGISISAFILRAVRHYLKFIKEEEELDSK